MTAQPTFGDQLKHWRRARRLSQMDLALDTEISSRHLSFLETGRAQPSREMVLRLAEQLRAPLRERNRMLIAAGYAPVYSDRAFDDPEIAVIRRTIDMILRGHMPNPVLAFDAGWNILSANAGIALLLGEIDPTAACLQGNIARLALHPQGLAPRIINLAEFRVHILYRLQSQLAATGDARLEALLAEIRTYPDAPASDARPDDHGQIAIPMRLIHDGGVLSFITTTTVFGSAHDVLVSELTLETFYPADEATERFLAAA